jgi:hypothetical protein
MTHLTALVDRYIAMWNEKDAPSRTALIADIWSDGASYVDPMLSGEGRDGIDAMVGQVQAKYPDHTFRRTSVVDAHNDHIRFNWSLATADEPPMVSGVDFGVVVDGRLQSITGFFEPAAQAGG